MLTVLRVLRLSLERERRRVGVLVMTWVFARRSSGLCPFACDGVTAVTAVTASMGMGEEEESVWGGSSGSGSGGEEATGGATR